MPAAELASVLDALRTAMEADNVQAIHAALMRSVEGYRPEVRHLPPSPPVDIGPPPPIASAGG